MKTLFLSALLACNVLPALSQTTQTPAKWSVGLIVLNDNSSFDAFSPNFLPGMTVRRHFDRFTLRAGAEMIRDSYASVKSDGYDNSFSRDLVFRAGIESGITIKKIFRPYVALDAAATFDTRTSRFASQLFKVDEAHYRHTRGFGLMPALGVELLLTKHFSISAETRLRVMREHTEEGATYYTGNIDARPVESRGWSTRFNQLGALTLHLRF